MAPTIFEVRRSCRRCFCIFSTKSPVESFNAEWAICRGTSDGKTKRCRKRKGRATTLSLRSLYQLVCRELRLQDPSTMSRQIRLERDTAVYIAPTRP